jgi:hypothetical protein
MVLGLVQQIQQSLKYRGGWKGLLQHMYAVSLFNWLGGGY